MAYVNYAEIQQLNPTLAEIDDATLAHLETLLEEYLNENDLEWGDISLDPNDLHEVIEEIYGTEIAASYVIGISSEYIKLGTLRPVNIALTNGNGIALLDMEGTLTNVVALNPDVIPKGYQALAQILVTGTGIENADDLVRHGVDIELVSNAINQGCNLIVDGYNVNYWLAA